MKDRISKPPDERKKELLEIALSLFLKYGYEKISIKDIADKAGVAPGLFYYYYKSKMQIFEDATKLYVEEFMKSDIDKICYSNISPIEKINKIIDILFYDNASNDALINEIYTNKNIRELHERTHKIVADFVSAFFEKIIIEGNEKLFFNCNYPKETSMILLHGCFEFIKEEIIKNPKITEENMIYYRNLAGEIAFKSIGVI